MIAALRFLLTPLVIAASFSTALHAAENEASKIDAGFFVPGFETDMKSLNEMHDLHGAQAFSDCTLWDAWLPHATLWNNGANRARYRHSFLNRRIDAEGYVSMQQHRGMAHSEGWPFPAWQQSTGIGWHFSIADEVWAIQVFGLKPLTTTAGWEISGATVEKIDPVEGLVLQATEDVVTVTTPSFSCGTIVAPFARLEWSARGLSADSRPQISWQLDGEATWKSQRQVGFPPLQESQGLTFANIPLYRHPEYAGLLKQYQLKFDHTRGSRISLKSLLTAIDTRHPITNVNFVRGSAEYFVWTRDVSFLQRNLARMRTALRFAITEFHVRELKRVQVRWVGHDGRSGLELGPDQKPKLRPGLGVGNNYYDLLPFGGDDALATIYLYDAVRKLAEIESAVARHPEWHIPQPETELSANGLEELAASIKTEAGRFFWDDSLGRLIGWQDLQGRRYDYGFVFLNTEAVAYDFATLEQRRQIYDWLDGKRNIAGDTSQGADIYHWRFAPRITTRRNIQDYVWAWSAPESIPWGNQIQDGGAVLGFSYFDLLARLTTNGPDDTWHRLQEILAWFREVQNEGGYRAYYAKPGRGTMQGGGPPGGLGIDHEFLESVLLPQVMLYGFLGFQPHPDGFTVNPRLPKDWPSLTIHGIQFHDQILKITAHADGRTDIESQSASVPVK